MKKLLLFLCAVSLVACMDVSGPGGSNPLLETFATSLGVNLGDTAVWKETGNGSYYKEVTIGTGASLLLTDFGDSVNFDYSLWLKDGSLVGTGTNISRPANSLITGFLDGMVNMKIGGVRMVVVPSNFGYGNVAQGAIPANSTLIFRIKLNSFTN